MKYVSYSVSYGSGLFCGHHYVMDLYLVETKNLPQVHHSHYYAVANDFLGEKIEL